MKIISTFTHTSNIDQTKDTFSKPFTVKLTEPWIVLNQKIILWKLCCCVARRKPIRHEKTKPQTEMVISLWFRSLLAHPKINWQLHNQNSWNFSGVFWFCEFDSKNHFAVFWILPTTVFKSQCVSQAIPGATYVCHHRWHVHDKHICTHTR